MPLTAAWFPALPPAPTSIVKKKTMDGCDANSASLPAWYSGKEKGVAH
jgi:hypothetical protein